MKGFSTRTLTRRVISLILLLAIAVSFGIITPYAAADSLQIINATLTEDTWDAIIPESAEDKVAIIVPPFNGIDLLAPGYIGLRTLQIKNETGDIYELVDYGFLFVWTHKYNLFDPSNPNSSVDFDAGTVTPSAEDQLKADDLFYFGIIPDLSTQSPVDLGNKDFLKSFTSSMGHYKNPSNSDTIMDQFPAQLDAEEHSIGVIVDLLTNQATINNEFQGATFTVQLALIYQRVAPPPITVTFDENTTDTVTGPTPGSKEVNTDEAYGTLAAVSRPGYSFQGWFTDPTGGTQITAATIVTATADHTLYAQWRQDPITVTFDPNTTAAVTGPNPGSKQVFTGNTYEALASVSRSGYTFLGWYTSPTGGTQVTAATTVTATANHTLYARWSADDDPTPPDPPTPPVTPEDPDTPDIPEPPAPPAPINPDYPLLPIDPDDPIYTSIDDWTVPLAPGLNRNDHNWYIRGFVDDTVRPEGHISRAEIAIIFYRLTQDDSKYDTVPRQVLSDVDPDAWYAKAVTYLYDCGIIKGDDNGNFRPTDNVTRAEVMAMAIKFDIFTLPAYNPFYDLTTEHWAAIPILAAWNNGWIFGYAEDATVRPDEHMARAEMMVFLNRVLHRSVALEDILPTAVGFADLATEHWAYCDIMEATNSHNYSRKYADEDGNYDEQDEIWTAVTGNGKNAAYNE